MAGITAGAGVVPAAGLRAFVAVDAVDEMPANA